MCETTSVCDEFKLLAIRCYELLERSILVLRMTIPRDLVCAALCDVGQSSSV